MSSEYIKKTKSNDQTYDYVKLVYLHFGLSPWIRFVTSSLKKERDVRFPCMASFLPRSSSFGTLHKSTAGTKRRVDAGSRKPLSMQTLRQVGKGCSIKVSACRNCRWSFRPYSDIDA
jgi:hypothetical protein